MKAAVLLDGGRRLEVKDVPMPTFERDEALIKVAGCGLCHTDLHYIDHGVKPFKDPPLILGHEAAGIVEDIGADVEGVSIGDRVLIPAVMSCGTCSYCRKGRDNLCDSLVMVGNNVDGAYAEYVAVRAVHLIPVPEQIRLEKACVIADAISTPYHAVKRRARVRPGDVVAVIGCGGVGLNVVQCARLAGASVVAIDVNEDRLHAAEMLGASRTIDPSHFDRVDKHVRSLTDGGVDIAFEAIGNPPTMQMAYSLLRRGGRLCVIGYSPKDLAVSAAKLMYYELEVIGSLGCCASEYPEIVRLVADGRLSLDPIVSGFISLDEINLGLDRLRAGEGVRWVATP